MTSDTSNDPTRQFCFTVSSPTGSFELQADNAVEQAEWMAALQVGLGRPCGPALLGVPAGW